MNKGKYGRKFGRERDQRKALLNGLVRALVLHEKIMTTEAKAKELRRYIEPIVTKSKVNSLHITRLLTRSLGGDVVNKLIRDIGTKYKDRKGGYTRVVKRAPRKRDSAKMAIIEFV